MHEEESSASHDLLMVRNSLKGCMDGLAEE